MATERSAQQREPLDLPCSLAAAARSLSARCSASVTASISPTSGRWEVQDKPSRRQIRGNRSGMKLAGARPESTRGRVRVIVHDRASSSG